MTPSGKSTGNKSRAHHRKDAVRDMLLERDLAEWTKWYESGHGVFRTLTSLLFDDDPLVVWRAIEAVGLAAKVIARTDDEKVARQIRRFLWMMNDESGALCRRGPEAIGEILVRVPSLFGGFGGILPSFLWEEPFEQGTRWAMYRLAVTHHAAAGEYKGCVGDLLASLNHADPGIRGYSLLALREIVRHAGDIVIEYPEVEDGLIPFYDFSDGSLKEISIASIGEMG